MLRSCYAVDMRFYRDDPTIKTRVQWYRTELTESMPWDSVFCSTIWDERDGEAELPLGEVFHPRPWRGGFAPFPTGNGGICGTQDEWLNGSLSTDPLPPLYPNTNVPTCCNPPLQKPVGGVAVGGVVTVTPPPNPCIPGALIPNNLCLLAKYVGTSPSGVTPPPWGIAPDYATPLVWSALAQGWFSSTFNFYNTINQLCGNVTVGFGCFLGSPWTFQVNIGFIIPGCSPPRQPFTTPSGVIQTVQYLPFKVVFLITSGPNAGWQWTVTDTPNCGILTACCPLGFPAVRTLTVEGLGMYGNMVATGNPSTNQWVFASRTVEGCGGDLFQATLRCGTDSYGHPVWQIQFLPGSCYAPGPAGTWYNATSVNCNLPVITFAGLPNGTTVTIT